MSLVLFLRHDNAYPKRVVWHKISTCAYRSAIQNLLMPSKTDPISRRCSISAHVRQFQHLHPAYYVSAICIAIKPNFAYRKNQLCKTVKHQTLNRLQLEELKDRKRNRESQRASQHKRLYITFNNTTAIRMKYPLQTQDLLEQHLPTTQMNARQLIRMPTSLHKERWLCMSETKSGTQFAKINALKHKKQNI